MARRPAKRGSSGKRKPAAGSGKGSSSNRAAPGTKQAPGTAHPAPGTGHSAPIRFPLGTQAPLTGATQGRVPLARVPLPTARPKGAARAPGSTTTSTVTPDRRPKVAPGPAPLPAAQPTPLLARVGGAAGTTSALEFITSPFSAVAELRPHALGITYWFDPPTATGPHEVRVRLTGRRLDVEGTRTPADDFVAMATLPQVQPGSRRTALTHRVVDKAPGRWHVTAEAIATPHGGKPSDAVRLPSAEGVGSTTFAPVATMRAPGVVLGAWPTMVGLGVVLALILQSTLARAHGLPTTKVLILALIASILGAAGAKIYYRLTHLKESGGRALAGLSVQGFVIVATVTFVLGGALQDLPIGHLLDATVPALLVGQAVGRLGCLFGGCCAGLPTRSRWGVWSSDRRVGTRRIPVQLMESAAAATLALLTAIIAWQVPTSAAGALFIAGVAAYIALRQILFPLRGVPRSTRHGRHITLAAALTLLAAALAALLLG